jgi:hypothetical protein
MLLALIGRMPPGMNQPAGEVRFDANLGHPKAGRIAAKLFATPMPASFTGDFTPSNSA